MNSIQILGFILICLYFTTGHFTNVYFAKNVPYFPFNSWLSFQRLCCLLWGYHFFPLDAISAVLAMALCLSVCMSVCPSQVGVLLKRLNVGLHKQHFTIAQRHLFSEAKDLREIRPGSPPTGAPNVGGVGQNRRLSINNRLYLENGKRS